VESGQNQTDCNQNVRRRDQKVVKEGDSIAKEMTEKNNNKQVIENRQRNVYK